MQKEFITVEALINAPIETVWEKWSNPEDIKQWSHASDDWHTPNASNDLRTGGTFSSTMAAKDGSFSFDFGGTYTDVQTHKHIAYTLGDGREVTVDFSTVNGQTQVTEKFEPEGQNPKEMQQQGWQAILNNFKKYTEANA